MSGSCDEVRLSLGAYLLDVLARADRAVVDTHLRTCVDCRAEIGSMKALPVLLARVRETEIAEAVDPSPELLDRVISLVAAQGLPPAN